MRRPQSAFGLAAVMSSLLVVTLFAAPADAARAPVEIAAAPTYDASSRCTVWGSQYVPPKTIRVLRSKRTDTPKSVAGTVQEVDFFDYVATTMAIEWPEHYPAETLRAGAVATKQFAWYYILNWRGGTKWVDGKRVCYDVVDSTIDQAFYPEKYGVGKPDGPGPKILAALDATWDISVRKYKTTTRSSRFFLTGYRAGASTVCGADATGFKLFHHSTKQCGKDGLKWRQILRLYLKPNLEIVEPGRHDVIGTKHGDASAMVRNESAQWVAHVWTPGRSGPEPGSTAGIKLASADLVGYHSADVNGDGDDDLVWLKKTGAKTGRIKVAISNGTNYGDDQVWWEGSTVVPLDGAKLLSGDFNADGRTDVGILGKGDSADKSRLFVLRRRGYNNSEKYGDPEQWWSGSQDISKVKDAWAGDLSGDGRADLIIRQNIDSGGVKVKTAVTQSPLPGGTQKMNALKIRFESTSLDAAKVKMIPADANRDGREDLLLLIGGSGQAKIERLQGQLLGGFKRVKVWTAPKSDPIPVEKTRLGAADIDFDGRTDLVVYSKKNDKTRIRVLRTRYDKMLQGPSWQESFSWGGVRPY